MDALALLSVIIMLVARKFSYTRGLSYKCSV